MFDILPWMMMLLVHDGNAGKVNGCLKGSEVNSERINGFNLEKSTEERIRAID